MHHTSKLFSVVLNLRPLGRRRGGNGASPSILNIKSKLKKIKHLQRIEFLKLPSFVFAWNALNHFKSSGCFRLITSFGWKLCVSLMNKNRKE